MKRAGLAALVAIAAAAPASQPQKMAIVYVVRAEGPGAREFSAGSKVEPGREIRLAAGSKLTLLDLRGTWLLVGPGSFRVDTTTNGTPYVFDIGRAVALRRIPRTAAPRASR